MKAIQPGQPITLQLIQLEDAALAILARPGRTSTRSILLTVKFVATSLSIDAGLDHQQSSRLACKLTSMVRKQQQI